MRVAFILLDGPTFLGLEVQKRWENSRYYAQIGEGFLSGGLPPGNPWSFPAERPRSHHGVMAKWVASRVASEDWGLCPVAA